MSEYSGDTEKIKHIRQLERELAAVTAERDEADALVTNHADVIGKLAAERDALREKVAQMSSACSRCGLMISHGSACPALRAALGEK